MCASEARIGTKFLPHASIRFDGPRARVEVDQIEYKAVRIPITCLRIVKLIKENEDWKYLVAVYSHLLPSMFDLHGVFLTEKGIYYITYTMR